MPNKPSLEKLVCAVAAEKAALEHSRHENNEIFRKTIAHLDGRGPFPIVDEFLHCRKSIQQIIFEKAIDSKLMDLESIR